MSIVNIYVIYDIPDIWWRKIQNSHSFQWKYMDKTEFLHENGETPT